MRMNVIYKKIVDAIKKVKLTVKIKTPFVDFSFVPLKIIGLVLTKDRGDYHK